MIEKFQVTKEFQMETLISNTYHQESKLDAKGNIIANKLLHMFNMNNELVSNTYWTGLELNIINNIVMDGCIKLFDINSDFAKEHGVIVNRLF